MKYWLYLFLLFIFIPTEIAAKNRKITGIVVSSTDNEPVMGATVILKENTKIGTLTDMDGSFHLNIPESAKYLEVSFVGMKTRKVLAKDHMEITLEPLSGLLEEVVVTGMQQIDKRLFTGATDYLDASKVLLDGINDISRSLEGRTAGVSVQNVSSTFGTAPKIRIRGATSIYGDSRPLWVVDGVILEDVVDISADQLSSGDAITLISSAVAGLNADDIESFQILKDGSATSIYGAKAMAGVIVITTKKGVAGQNRINYTGELSYRLKPSYSSFNINNSQQQMGIYKEMYEKGWLEFSDFTTIASSGVYGKMYQLINQYDETRGQYGIPFTQSAMNAYLRQAEFRNTDWFDELFNANIVQSHSLSLSGGSDKTRFYTSFSTLQDPGWTVSNKIERYTFNANLVTDISKKLSFILSTGNSYRKQKAPGTLSRNVDVVRGEVKRDFDINPFSYALNTSRTMDFNETYTRNYTDFNIINELENNYIDLNVLDVKFQGELNWKPFTGFRINMLSAFRYINSEQEHLIKDYSNHANAYRAGISPENALIRDINPLLFKDPYDDKALPKTILPEGGIYLNDTYSLSKFDFRLTAQYANAFSEDHIYNLFGGMEINQTDRNMVGFEGWGFCYDDGGIPFVDPDLFIQNSSYYYKTWKYERGVAWFAQTSYSYKKRYIATLTGRYEGSNKLGKSHKSRWLPTWNIGAAWNAHEESWFTSTVVSHAALRASYSLVADGGPYWVTNSTPVYEANQPWRPLSRVREIGITLKDIENSELTYEKKKEFNVGLDVGIWNNRLNVSLDYYFRNNYDLIGIINTPGLGGFIKKYANVADMKSHGIEVSLSSKNIQSSHFSWLSDIVFSKNKNEITDLIAQSNVAQLVMGSGFAREGYPVRALFSIPFVGLNADGFPTFINQDGEVTVWNINFQEFSKLDFLKYEGPSDPSITGGFNNTFSYKNFSLNAFISYSFGNKVRLDPVFSASYSDMSALPTEFKNRWILTGDEKYTKIPVIASKRQIEDNPNLSKAYNAYNYSTERIADGGFIRMKEISLTYDIPSDIMRKIKINKASLKLQATNLFLIYADKKLNGQDPEFFNSGGVAFPAPKQFTFSIRLTL